MALSIHGLIDGQKCYAMVRECDGLRGSIVPIARASRSLKTATIRRRFAASATSAVVAVDGLTT